MYVNPQLDANGVFVCLCRISAAGQMDRRDSLGVCIDSESEEESLQRDQAVCISTNGTPPQIDFKDLCSGRVCAAHS